MFKLFTRIVLGDREDSDCEATDEENSAPVANAAVVVIEEEPPATAEATLLVRILTRFIQHSH